MFERYTDKARRVIVLSQEEARRLNHGHIGTEHLLLGVIAEGDGVAAKALLQLDITLELARTATLLVVGGDEGNVSGDIPFTPSAKRVMERSLREALHLGHNYIGTEHLLLALLREGDKASDLLLELKIDVNQLQRTMFSIMSPGLERAMQPADFEHRDVDEIMHDLDVSIAHQRELMVELRAALRAQH